MKNTYYVAGILCEEVNVKTKDTETSISLHWADGMVGALPVFRIRKDAEEYAKQNGGASVIEIESSQK